MRHSLKKMMIAFLLCTAAYHAPAQWCVPTTLIPYASSMPGITQFTLNTINRSSGDNEHHPGNNYTNTNLSTTLVPGTTYSVTIGHTIDASICPDMNLRVWIDYNKDYQLNDVGETVISVDHHLPGTYTGNFTVPLTALTGTTRMRVTAKMSNLGGHSLPDPCDIPADPLGYHGEMEDYTIVISTASSVADVPSGVNSIRVFPVPVTSSSRVSYEMSCPGLVNAELISPVGLKILDLSPEGIQSAGFHSFPLQLPADVANGYYLLKIYTSNSLVTKKLPVFRQQ